MSGHRLQAVQVVRPQPKKRRCLGPSGFVDATRRRRRVGHARSGTEERRAYVRLGRGPSPFRCAPGRFDATSAWRSPNDACCSRAFSAARSARILLERPLQKLALGSRSEHQPGAPRSRAARKMTASSASRKPRSRNAMASTANVARSHRTSVGESCASSQNCGDALTERMPYAARMG